ncbi:laminin subunit gamma-1-like protein [Dinothrombium tinctorium]|uniref:Laminin subunit gamma-1-like protein n=1 Tax=Dinothrombium tinctorium TaxID=1965070 RepID=A0A443R441_9ACAR|nr:laminin subunit gamma-1-like protein [Dinothrombium tinctorium]
MAITLRTFLASSRTARIVHQRRCPNRTTSSSSPFNLSLFNLLSFSIVFFVLIHTTAEQSSIRYDYNYNRNINFDIRNGNRQYDVKQHQTFSCYDILNGKAQRCYPHFENAAYLRPIEATNTCGEQKDTPYCLQTGNTNPDKTCLICRKGDHPPRNLNDFNDNNTLTWWQSETMLDGIQYPNEVNITLDLGKAFDITYVRLKFHSPRPQSFAIYKKEREDSEWVPFQYYSSTCLQTYRVNESSEAPLEDETRALCTSEFSEISPLTDGTAVFTTLEGRPSANYFERSPVLQKFVTATKIRIVLNRLNTFGDEIFRDPNVLRSYYYAISDLAVGGRCKCNGHASRCIPRDNDDAYGRLKCDCKHNTAGIDCEKCDDFYWDQDWAVATPDDAHECKPCNCNGKSNRCFFDKELYERTGHGGHCLDCRDNTDGPNCERCKPNFYQNAQGICIACNCNEIGSESLQCNSQGKCTCKPGVTGQKCDRCESNHYDFSVSGCKSCECNLAGSVGEGECDPVYGRCRCKPNVEGQRCDTCKPGFFDLQADNEFGCLPCFCFGHSSVCYSTAGYSKYSIESTFNRDDERWTAKERDGRTVETVYNPLTGTLSVRAERDETIYFVAPERYRGDQRGAYNQHLYFTFRIGDENVRSAFDDVVIRGTDLAISQPVFGQGNGIPSSKPKIFKFRLHDDVSYGWTPRLTSKEFIGILSNITSIEIRGNYYPRGTGYLDDVKLETIQQSPYGQKATWVETCKCPTGYVGQYCESCAPGFRRDPPNGGSFASCVPCNCNGHADDCDAETGKIFFLFSLGTPNDCEPCNCPGGGACVVLNDKRVACIECPEGYTGFKCELCVDGYYGDPEGKFGPPQPCRQCDCNGNVDSNAIGNCDSITGECLKCIYNTYGSHCEKCAPGFYGDALTQPKGNCKSCGCHPRGTISSEVKITSRSMEISFLCDQFSGQCDCKNHVMGRQCDQCVDGYWNLASGNGCEPCNCNPLGSEGRTCDERTGQCKCKAGVTGLKCDQCLPEHYGYSAKGCQACYCDRIGSLSAQCDERGQCPCQKNIEGLHCERCRENMYNKSAGCIECPPCYNLVQDAVNAHRSKLGHLMQLLDEIERNPHVVQDKNFEDQLRDEMLKVEALLRDAKRAQGADGSLTSQLEDLKMRVEKVRELAAQVRARMEPIETIIIHGKQNITAAEELVERARNALSNARKLLDNEGMYALQKARERSKKYGQQSERMSEIARITRTLADTHESDAQTIQTIINDALNTSRYAQELAKDAIQTQESNRAQIERLRKQLEEANDLLQRTKKMADEAKRVADKAFNDAVEIYTKVNSITVTDLQAEKLKQEALDLIEQAKKIARDADEILQRFGDTLNVTKTQLSDTNALLEEAKRQQQITDGLLADVDAAFQRAQEAVDSGEATLKKANETLHTLKEFDKRVQESKAKAMEALRNVDNIRKLIDEAEEKTLEAENALQGALKDAVEARDVAIEAQQIAEKASQDAKRIQEEAAATKSKAGRLKNQAQDLTNNIERTSERMKEYEDQAENDDNKAKDALERAGQAKSSAESATNKIKNASSTIDEILEALENLDDIDSSVLDDLEKRLNEAENELREADLDRRIEILKREQAKQTQRMRNYDDEIARLRLDVANIKEIREAIPNACFKRNTLEP